MRRSRNNNDPIGDALLAAGVVLAAVLFGLGVIVGASAVWGMS